MDLNQFKGKNIQVVVSIDDLIEFAAGIEENVVRRISEIVGAKQTPDELLTLEETAAFFKKSAVTIHAWKKAGILKYTRMGNKIYFRKSDLVNLPQITLKKT